MVKKVVKNIDKATGCKKKESKKYTKKVSQKVKKVIK